MGSLVLVEEREVGGRNLLSVVSFNLQREQLASILMCLFGEKEIIVVFYCIISASKLKCSPSSSINTHTLIFHIINNLCRKKSN